jgi:predicted histone-like DNA-binding protein
MALKVKAVERLLKFNKETAGEYRYVMKPELYIALSQKKVIREAALRSGVSQGVMQACWDAAGEVIKAWATEGHSVALPGLGSMRFGLRSKSVADVNDVRTGLIKSRRIVFTPSVDLKEELSATAIVITCYDRNGNEVKRVTSGDEGKVEDPEDGTDPEGGDGGNSGSTESGNHGNTDGGSVDPNPVNPDPAAGETYSIAAGVSVDGGGTVSIKKNGTAVAGNSVEATGSDTVVIEAVAENDNFQFMSWSDGSSQNPRTIQPSADMNLEASFMDLSKI